MNLEWSRAEIESAGSLDGGSQLSGILVKLKVGGLSGKDARPSPNDESRSFIKAKLSLLWKEQRNFLCRAILCRHSGRSEPAIAQRHAKGGTDPDRVGKGPFLRVLSLNL
jgi:hypothetical protein